MQETQARSPGQEDPLKKEMVTHSSTLTWEIPRTLQEVATCWTQLSDFHFSSLHSCFMSGGVLRSFDLPLGWPHPRAETGPHFPAEGTFLSLCSRLDNRALLSWATAV